MEQLRALLIVLFVGTAFSAAAASGEEQIRIAECNGEQFVWVDNTMTATEIAVMFPNLPPKPDGERILMQFEPSTPDGKRFYAWGDMSTSYLEKNYCADARYRQNKPLPGTWSFELVSSDLSGCPQGKSPAETMTGVRNLDWKGFRPKTILADSQLPFEYQTITLSHKIARVDALPNMPGTVLVEYDFYLNSKTKFTINAQLDLTFPTPGGPPTRCFGKFQIVATHQG